MLKVQLFSVPNPHHHRRYKTIISCYDSLPPSQMSFPFVWNQDEAAEAELNQLLCTTLPPLFPSENSITNTEGWETALLEGTSSPDCLAAFSALDLTVPPPPPAKAPVPIAPAVFLPAAENISMERRYN